MLFLTRLVVFLTVFLLTILSEMNKVSSKKVKKCFDLKVAYIKTGYSYKPDVPNLITINLQCKRQTATIRIFGNVKYSIPANEEEYCLDRNKKCTGEKPCTCCTMPAGICYKYLDVRYLKTCNNTLGNCTLHIPRKELGTYCKNLNYTCDPPSKCYARWAEVSYNCIPPGNVTNDPTVKNKTVTLQSSTTSRTISTSAEVAYHPNVIRTTKKLTPTTRTRQETIYTSSTQEPELPETSSATITTAMLNITANMEIHTSNSKGLYIGISLAVVIVCLTIIIFTIICIRKRQQIKEKASKLQTFKTTSYKNIIQTSEPTFLSTTEMSQSYEYMPLNNSTETEPVKNQKNDTNYDNVQVNIVPNYTKVDNSEKKNSNELAKLYIKKSNDIELIENNYYEGGFDTNSEPVKENTDENDYEIDFVNENTPNVCSVRNKTLPVQKKTTVFSESKNLGAKNKKFKDKKNKDGNESDDSYQEIDDSDIVTVTPSSPKVNNNPEHLTIKSGYCLEKASNETPKKVSPPLFKPIASKTRESQRQADLKKKKANTEDYDYTYAHFQLEGRKRSPHIIN